MTTHTPIQVRRNAMMMLRAMDELRKISPHCGSNMIAAFVLIALKPGVTVGGLQEFLGMPATSTARSLTGLLKMGRKRSPGLNLVEQRNDDYDRRIRHLHLTPKGRKVWEAMERHFLHDSKATRDDLSL